MDWNIKYGELSKDKDFVNKCEGLKENLKEVQKILDQLLPLKEHYDNLTLPAQIELDLFLAYTLTSFHWIHLRIQGLDPTEDAVRDELQRIKVVMVKWQEMKDHEKRPMLDVDAAKRFIKSGLYDAYRGTGKPLNKKIKFPENAE